MSLTDKLMSRLDSKAAFKFSEINNFEDVTSWINTGSPALDYNMRTKGLPTGIIEVRGDTQSGKTTMSLHAIKSTLQQYGERAVVVILSSERRDNKDLATMIGIDTDRVMIIHTRTVEQVFNEFAKVVRETNKIWSEDDIDGRPRFLFVWDSLGQTVSKDEVAAMEIRIDPKKKGDEDKAPAMASAARAISMGLRGTLGLLDNNEITFFIINRAYEPMNGGYNQKSYGGKAVGFYPTMRLELSRLEGIKVGDDEVGQVTQVKVIKNDFGPPNKKFTFEIGYGYGIVLSDDDIELGIKHGVLKKNGHGAKFNDKLSWANTRELYAHYERKNPMLKVLMSKLTSVLHDAVVEERQEALDK